MTWRCWWIAEISDLKCREGALKSSRLIHSEVPSFDKMKSHGQDSVIVLLDILELNLAALPAEHIFFFVFLNWIKISVVFIPIGTFNSDLCNPRLELVSGWLEKVTLRARSQPALGKFLRSGMVRSLLLFPVTGEWRRLQQDSTSWLLFHSRLQVLPPPEHRGLAHFYPSRPQHLCTVCVCVRSCDTIVISLWPCLQVALRWERRRGSLL